MKASTPVKPSTRGRGLRLCRADRLRQRGPCRGWAINNGYCWFHHLSVFNTEMWGDHEWLPARSEEAACSR